MTEIRALTVKPPWSWAIAHGRKTIENRSWATQYRGPIAIHAGKAWDGDGESSPHVQSAWRRFVAELPPMKCHHGPLRRESLWMHSGAVVAVADLVDVCTVQGGHTSCDCGQWAAPFQCHWRLDNVRPLAEPVSAKGALSLWRLPDDVDAAVRAQLGVEVATRA